MEKKKRKYSLIVVAGISILLIALACSIINENLSENYNDRIDEYLGHSSLYTRRIIRNVERLVNVLADNNKNTRKTSIIYKENEYVNPDDLKELLSIIDTNRAYDFYLTYDNFGFMKSIEITESLYSLFLNFSKKENEIIKGREIKKLLNDANRCVSEKKNYNESYSLHIELTLKNKETEAIEFTTNNKMNIERIKKVIEDNGMYLMDTDELYPYEGNEFSIYFYER